MSIPMSSEIVSPSHWALGRLNWDAALPFPIDTFWP